MAKKKLNIVEYTDPNSEVETKYEIGNMFRPESGGWSIKILHGAAKTITDNIVTDES